MTKMTDKLVMTKELLIEALSDNPEFSLLEIFKLSFSDSRDECENKIEDWKSTDDEFMAKYREVMQERCSLVFVGGKIKHRHFTDSQLDEFFRALMENKGKQFSASRKAGMNYITFKKSIDPESSTYNEALAERYAAAKFMIGMQAEDHLHDKAFTNAEGDLGALKMILSRNHPDYKEEKNPQINIDAEKVLIVQDLSARFTGDAKTIELGENAGV